MLRGANGVVDHRLARRALINEVKRGRISKDSVCDAHPELIRAARHLGEETTTPCPICEEVNVVLLTYVFGHGLPKHGRCITKRSEITSLQKSPHDYAAYVVEACPSCSWHHLLRVLPVTGRRPVQRRGATSS
ncbi:MAG: hypothetical protein RLZ84_1723 [Actinomycetota bacterium]